MHEDRAGQNLYLLLRFGVLDNEAAFQAAFIWLQSLTKQTLYETFFDGCVEIVNMPTARNCDVMCDDVQAVKIQNMGLLAKITYRVRSQSFIKFNS
jgi:hypothetical protein